MSKCYPNLPPNIIRTKCYPNLPRSSLQASFVQGRSDAQPVIVAFSRYNLCLNGRNTSKAPSRREDLVIEHQKSGIPDLKWSRSELKSISSIISAGTVWIYIWIGQNSSLPAKNPSFQSLSQDGGCVQVKPCVDLVSSKTTRDYWSNKISEHLNKAHTRWFSKMRPQIISIFESISLNFRC